MAWATFVLLIAFSVIWKGKCELCEQKAFTNCVVFDNTSVKTFDGNVFSFESTCDYKLLTIDTVNLEIHVLKNPTTLQIKYYQHSFQLNVTDGSVKLSRDGVPKSIPQTLNGITFSKPGRMVITEIKSVGIKIRFDGDEIEIIKNNEDHVHQMHGLCGNNDGCVSNDLEMASGEDATSQVCFANSWALDPECAAEHFENTCNDNDRLLGQAVNYCTNLFANGRFSECWTYSQHFRDICASKYCSCKLANRDDCMCDMLDVFVKTCEVNLNFVTEWRTPELCPITCSNFDQSFSACAPNNKQLYCGEEEITDSSEYDCEEGCYCPEGMRLFQGECLFPNECPCFYEDFWANPGDSIAQECNTCTCIEGQWDCTNNLCTCDGEAWGDPHFITFDKRKFDFMGKCTYYVARGIGFDVMCDHYIVKSGSYVKEFDSSAPSYCAKVIVESENVRIELGQKQSVTVNGNQIDWLPYSVSGIRINQPSSQITNVELRNLVSVRWNGNNRIIVKIPTSMKDSVNGLFGTCNGNKTDDFTMPNGTSTVNANDFGHSWVVPGSCAENTNTDEVKHPCETYPSKKPEAEERCGILKSELFAGCSDDIEGDYEDCVYDGCLCPDNDPGCLCEFYLQQAEKCAAKGQLIDWRQKIPDCAIQCPSGQEHQVCGNPCARSCSDIIQNTECVADCVEGCNCPPGTTLDDTNDCIPIEECPCVYNNTKYLPEFTFIDGDSKHVCENALWNVTDATDEDKENYPTLEELQNHCDRDRFLTFTGCKRNNELTCMNKHLNERANYTNCEKDCECMEGFIMDTNRNMCVPSEECPCMHNGISHPDNATINDREQNCTCVNEFWECVPQTDHWEKCSVWGNLHVRTFDESFFSFNASCEFNLFEYIFKNGVFRVKLQTTYTYSGYAIYGASVYLRWNGFVENVVFIIGNKYIATVLQELVLNDLDVSTVIDVPNLALKIVWNKAGWIHIHAHQFWITREFTGLCGKYDNDPSNDFEISDLELNGITDFVDYNRADRTCIDSTELSPINGIFPDDPCNVLLSETFKMCRLVKPVKKYFERCIIESKMYITPEEAANRLCKTVAVYAQECNDIGASVEWRTEEFCPYVCNEDQEYASCETTCLKETCNNANENCSEAICVEGCRVAQCADGEVFDNEMYQNCVSKDECPVVGE